MPLTELTLPDLERYAPAREEPADFDAFWARTLAEAREYPMKPRLEPVNSYLHAVQVRDVTFPGFGGDPIKGWFVRPGAGAGPLPCVVTYIGYGGGRGLPHDRLLYAAAGYANLVMDTRGQLGGDTADRCPDPVDPQNPGFMTRGITAPETYYYRRLVTDAVRAVEAARAIPEVDPERIVIGGGSQGGGLTLAVAGLADGISAALVDVPFLCHWRRAMDVASDGPYPELVTYCAARRQDTEQVFTTLSYLDGVNFAARASAPALFSVALMDPVCPPSTVYAAHYHYAGRKQMCVWPYNGHEGGQSHQQAEHLRFLRDMLAG